LRLPLVYSFPLGDGSSCEVTWDRDWASYGAQRFDDEEAIEDGHEWVDCPGPDTGLFDDLEAIEIAMATPIPEDVRHALLAERAAFPPDPAVLRYWGESVAFEVYRSTPDGRVVATYGPTGAVDNGWMLEAHGCWMSGP
jgi:hypothetical protein